MHHRCVRCAREMPDGLWYKVLTALADPFADPLYWSAAAAGVRCSKGGAGWVGGALDVEKQKLREFGQKVAVCFFRKMCY